LLPLNLRSLPPRSSWAGWIRWAWVERALYLIAIVCLGFYAWVWIDARLFERKQNELLEQAGRQHALRTLASVTDSFEALSRGAERAQGRSPQPPALQEGELIGRVSIPRIGVSAILLEGVDTRTLRRGAGHIPATALPAAEGNTGIAAHRDSFFRGLKDIREGDAIELTTLDGTYTYQVQWTRIVRPDDVSVLEPTDRAALTLVTCYPFYYVGSAPQRFIVRARRTDKDPLS
jgi:sortase A